jgi:predicted dinucleotide-binding enzyme
MKIGVLGSGDVAKVLAGGLITHGHDVMIGSRTPAKMADWTSSNPKAVAGTFADVAQFGELIVLAVKGTAAHDALQLAGASNLAGKAVIDATNPIADAPPVNGVLKFFTDLDESLMERLQKAFPAAHLVKAFSSVGNTCMVNPQFEGGKPTMFIAGTMKRRRRRCAEFLINSDGKRLTWERPRPPAPLNRYACFGASRASCVTTGFMPSSFLRRLRPPSPSFQRTAFDSR